MPVPSTLPKNAVLDSVEHRFGDGMRAWRILNREDLWAVQDVWFQIPGRPEYLHYARLDSLTSADGFSDSAILYQVRYRYPVKAKTVEEAKTAAFSQRPPVPSKVVRRLMERIVREMAAPAAAAPR
jgi:hypothetical protein